MPEIYSRRAFLKIAMGSALTFSQQACGGETAPISPTADKIATSKPETPTLTPTPTNTPEPTPTPTETSSSEPEGSRGNVKSIDNLEHDQPIKEAIKRILGNAELEIATNELIVAIDPSLKAREQNPMKSIRLNIEDYPFEEIGRMVKQAQKDTFTLATASQMEKKFLTQPEVNKLLTADTVVNFSLRAKNPADKGNRRRNVKIDNNSLNFPLVIVYRATGENMGFEYSSAKRFEHVFDTGVVSLEIAADDPVGTTMPLRSDGFNVVKIHAAGDIATGLATMTDYKTLQVVPEGLRAYTSGEASLIIPVLLAIYNNLTSPKEAPGTRKTNSIFRAN